MILDEEDELLKEFQPVAIVFDAEHFVQERQLTDGVDDVEDFRENVDHHEIVALKLAVHAAEHGLDTLENTEVAILSTPSRIVDEFVDRGNDVVHDLPSLVHAIDRFVAFARFDDVLQVQATARHQGLPDQIGNVEKNTEETLSSREQRRSPT